MYKCIPYRSVQIRWKDSGGGTFQSYSTDLILVFILVRAHWRGRGKGVRL